MTIGNNSRVADATLIFTAPTGKVNQIQFKRNGSNSWLFYDADSSSFYFRDSVNGVMQLQLFPGTASTGRAILGVRMTAVAAQGIEMGSSGPRWSAGTGSPEGVVSAPPGSLYSRTDGSTGSSLYVKETGAGGATGWVAK